jgi:F0F1-type ATP synthase assembly protein I
MGMAWMSRITSIALSFVVPGVAGVFLDRWVGSGPFGAVVGVVVGFVVGTMQILRIAKSQSPS